MDYREEIAGIGDVVGESIAVGSKAKSESNMVDSLLDKEISRIVGELEDKGGLQLNESESLGISPSKHEEELTRKVREQSDENQTVNEIDGTEENEQGAFPELSKETFRLKEERNTESIESCPPISEVHHHPGNETGAVEDGKITAITVPEILPGKEIEAEDVKPNVVVEPNIEHETVIREKDDTTTEEPEIITYHGRDLAGEGYRGNLPKVGLENEVGVVKGEEVGIFSSSEDARKPVTEGGDDTDDQIEGTVDKVDVEVPNEKVAPDILNAKDDSVDGLPSAEVSSLRDIIDEDEILKTSNDDADEINFGNHKEEDVQEDDVIGNDGLSKDRELTTIETATEETGLPAPGAPSNGDSASHPDNDFAEVGKSEGSEADSAGLTREITDQVAIERDDASPDSNVYTEAIDGDLGNDPFSVPERTQDELQPDIAEKEAPSGSTASNEFDIAGEDGTSSGLMLSGDQTTKDYEEVNSRSISSEVVQEKAPEVSAVQADTVPGRDNDTEAHSVKDDDTCTRKEDETLESTDRDAETDDASDPIKREVPLVADSLEDFVQQETQVIPSEQESLTETSARSSVVENFAEERNALEEALSTLEDQPLDVPGASSEVKHKSEESNISEEVHLHAGLSALTDGANEVSETQTANIPEVLAEEKLDVDQRSTELDAEILSAVPVDSNIDGQLASNKASNYKEASAADAVVTESKIPYEEKILKKSFKQLKQDADEIDEDGKPTLTDGESKQELDEVPDREKVLEDTNTSASNVLNGTLKKSETEMNTKQPHDMADQGSRSDDQLASKEDPKYEESSAAEVVTNSMILEEKILARSFDGESEDADEVEKYEETAAGKGNSAREHDEVPAREEVPSVLDETIVDGVQQLDIANQTDVPLTEATVETTEKATVYNSAMDASTDNQRDISDFGTMTQDQELETNQMRDEPTNDDAASTLQNGTKIDTQTEETPDITLSETTDEVASNIQEDDSFGVAGELSKNLIDSQSAFSEASNYEEASVAEAVVTESKIPEETATEEQLRQDTDEIDNAREVDEVPNQEVLEATNASAGNTPNEKFEQLKTEVSGEQPHDMAGQGDIALIEVPGELIKKDGVDTTIPLVDQKDGHGDDQLASNEDPKHGESSVAEAVTESGILEEKILTRSFNDSLEAQIGQDVDEAEKYRETALREGNTAREHEVPAREEVPSILDETIVDDVQQQDFDDQTDIALTEATVEIKEKAAVYDSATDASTNDQRDVPHFVTLMQDQELKTNKRQNQPTDDDDASTCWDYAKIDTQTEETSDITLSETTNEVSSKIQEDDSFRVAGEVLENPIEESAILPDETIKSEEISGERQDVEEPALGQGDKGSSLVDAEETYDEAVFSHSELVESAVAEEGILDQGIGTENSNERDSSLVPPEENEVKDQVVPLGAATDSFSERQEQDKEAREPYEEIPHPEQRDLLVDITEANYDRGTSGAIMSDTQELQKDEACIENKSEALENEGIRGLLRKDQQENVQCILAEEVALEGEIASKDVKTDRIVQEDEKGIKEVENSREANEDEINKDGEVDMGSSTINEVNFTQETNKAAGSSVVNLNNNGNVPLQESLATVASATEKANLENKDSYTTAGNSHVEVIEGEKRDLTLSNEIAEEGDSYSAGKEESTNAVIEETSEALIDSNGHKVEVSRQRDLINATEVSDEAALLDAPNETVTTIQTVPTADSSAMEFYRENEREVQDRTFNEQASQIEIDNQDLAADMPTDVKLDEQTDVIGGSLPPEAETGGNERNQVLQNEAETKEGFSGEEALQSTELLSDGPSDQMSAFSTSVPDVQERERHKIVVLEDDQTSRTVQEKVDDESQNKVEQEDNAEKVEQEFTSNEEIPTNRELFEETISSDQLAQSRGKESNGSLGGENASEVIKDIYADVGEVPAEDAEADITKTTQPTQITGNLKEESIEKTSASVIPDENYDSKEQSFFEPVPHEEATLVETEDVEPASVEESTLKQNPLSDVSRDESTLLHGQTKAWPDGNERTLQIGVRQDESDTGMPKYAEKEIDVPATGKIAPLELGDRDFSSFVPTKDISTEEDASKNEEVESVDIAADHTEEQPSVTTEDMIRKDKEVRDDTEHATGKPKDMIETYEDKTSAAASVINAKTTIKHGNEAAAEVGESLDDAIEEVTPMTSDSSSAVPKEGEMLATETEHEKANASLEISQRNLTDTSDLKDININEMAANIPSTDEQAVTGSVSYLPQGSIDAITAASVDQESVSLTLPSEETVVDKAWTSRESPKDKHLELCFMETGSGDDTAEKNGESRNLDFTSVQADQETKNEINGSEILSDGYGADKAEYGLASETVEIAEKVDPSLKEKEEKAFDEAQILQEKASLEQDEYKQGAADEDKAPILSDANDPVEGTVDRSPPEEAEGQTFDSVEGNRKMETPVPNIQGSSEEIFELDRTPSLEESKGRNQVNASKENSDSGLPRDASLVKEVTANLPGSAERGMPPAEAREFIDQSEVNLESKEFEGEKFLADTTTVLETPVADNLQLPKQSPIIKPDENEENEDNDHEHIEHSDVAPLMEESSKDVVDGKALHKKSHNHLLSGMSSKVKSSISKVKKVITGKSSNHNKEHSPKQGSE